jgi:hypothetical protein
MIIHIKKKNHTLCSFNVSNININNYYPNYIGYHTLETDINESCSICLNQFIKDDKIKLWPKCNHIFHHSCYTELRNEHKIITCPMCRSELKEIKINRQHRCMFIDFISSS